MTTVCSTAVCGTGGWNGPLPGDPDNSSVLSAVSDFGGVQLTWTLPSTNSHAVAYTQIYRSISDVFETAIPFTAVSATGYFDRSAADVIRPYYYWIQHVSTYGTTLDPIGPAMAVAKPQIDQVLSALAGKVEGSFLADSLRARIDVISDLENGLTQINSKVTSDNAVFAQELTALRNTMSDALAYVDAQQSLSITDRQALVTSLNTQLAQFSTDMYAAIQDEATTRAEETGELFAQKTLKIDLAGNVAGYGLSARVDPTGQYDSAFQVRADSFSIAAPAVSRNSAPLNPYNGMIWEDTSVTPSVTKWFNKAAGAWQTTPVKGAEPFVYRSTPTTIDGYTIEPGMYVSGAVIDRISARQIDTRGLIIRDLDGSPVIQMGSAIDWSKLGGNSNLQAMGYTGALDATRNMARGPWTSGLMYQEGDLVLFGDQTWACVEQHVSHSTKQPPSPPDFSNQYWAVFGLSGAPGIDYDVVITSSQGNVFRVGQGRQTTLVARVFRNGEEITDTLPTSAFKWSRVSSIPREAPYDDATWNAQYQAGYKQITISVDDVNSRATFNCEIDI